MTTQFNENSPGGEYQLDSMIQRTSGGQKAGEVKPVEVEEVEEWEEEKF